MTHQPVPNFRDGDQFEIADASGSGTYLMTRTDGRWPCPCGQIHDDEQVEADLSEGNGRHIPAQAPHADRDHSEQPGLTPRPGTFDESRYAHRLPTPSTGAASSDPTHAGTPQSGNAREARWLEAIGEGLGCWDGDECDECVGAAKAGMTVADVEQAALRAERDDLAERLSALLCELTGGRLSKTTYDVRTMVQEVDSAYDDAHQEDRAERDRLAGELGRMKARLWRLIESVEASCGDEPVCHDFDRTDDGRCALVASLRAVQSPAQTPAASEETR